MFLSLDHVGENCILAFSGEGIGFLFKFFELVFEVDLVD